MSHSDLVFLTQAILLYGSVSTLLHLPLWALAYQWKRFAVADLMLPFAAFLAWSACIVLEAGRTASLANAAVEPLLAVALSLAIYSIRIASRIPASWPISLLTNALVALAVIAMRFAMPGLPE